AVLSTTSWDHAPLIGGSAFNMKSSRAVLNEPGGPDRLRELIVGFLRRGGFETQINVLDPETLLRARAEPEAYRDLVVRIGGYTDYFVRLSPEMQDEVIRRTTYDRVA
ncbi:MAG: glycine radical domain-containing protein, partial [Planctomycetota bacterium]